MKTFEDLEFKPHPWLEDGLQARLNFDNGYGVSVLFGKGFYSNGIDTYEIACLENGHLVYPPGTSFEQDVIGRCSKEEITSLMEEIQSFPPVK